MGQTSGQFGRGLGGADESVALGNANCLLCRHFRLLPFRRCGYCSLSGARRCPTLMAAVLLLTIWAVTGVLANRISGRTTQMVFIMTGLLTGVVLTLINSYTDQHSRDRRQLRQLHEELAQQHEFLNELVPLKGLSECVEHVVANTCRRLRCRRVSVMLPDASGNWLTIAAARGLPEEIVRTTRVPIGERICGKVFQVGQPVHVYRGGTPDFGPTLSVEAQGFMCSPLMLSGMRWGSERLGVLSATDPIDREDFTVDDEFVFSNICAAAAVAVHNHKAMASVEQANIEFLETLINAVEARDEYTRGHSDRVCDYALAIGRRLDLSAEGLRHLQMAARLHDVGKIGVPDAVLGKPGGLDDREWDIVRTHPDIAVDMLAKSSLVRPALDAIVHHHERLDGTGYPHGLVGEEIPLLARVVGVADAFDAMTTGRPYRKPVDLPEAMEVLRAGRGAQFDSDCVDALLAAIDEGEFVDLTLRLIGRIA